jgi:hypothetical protein
MLHLHVDGICNSSTGLYLSIRVPHGGKLDPADDALSFAIALSTPDWKGMAQRSRSHSRSLQHTMALLPADAHSMYDILVLDDINTAYEQQALDLSQTGTLVLATALEGGACLATALRGHMEALNSM